MERTPSPRATPPAGAGRRPRPGLKPLIAHRPRRRPAPYVLGSIIFVESRPVAARRDAPIRRPVQHRRAVARTDVLERDKQRRHGQAVPRQHI